MRFVLPYLHPDGSKKGADAMRDYAERRVAKKPLGLLIDQFEEAAEGDKQPLVQELRAFVIARNELVHNFCRNPSFNLTSPDGVRAAVAYLDAQYEQAREWARIFRATGAAVFLALMERNPELTSKLAPHREKLMAQLSRSANSEKADLVIE